MSKGKAEVRYYWIKGCSNIIGWWKLGSKTLPQVFHKYQPHLDAEPWVLMTLRCLLFAARLRKMMGKTESAGNGHHDHNISLHTPQSLNTWSKGENICSGSTLRANSGWRSEHASWWTRQSFLLWVVAALYNCFPFFSLPKFCKKNAFALKSNADT